MISTIPMVCVIDKIPSDDYQNPNRGIDQCSMTKAQERGRSSTAPGGRLGVVFANSDFRPGRFNTNSTESSCMESESEEMDDSSLEETSFDGDEPSSNAKYTKKRILEISSSRKQARDSTLLSRVSKHNSRIDQMMPSTRHPEKAIGATLARSSVIINRIRRRKGLKHLHHHSSVKNGGQ